MKERLLIFTTFILSVTYTFPQCNSDGPLYYSKTEVFVYQNMSANAAIITEVPKGASVKVVNSFFGDHGWWEVCYNGTIGWVKKSLLTYKKPDEKTLSSNSQDGEDKKGGNPFSKSLTRFDDDTFTPSTVVGYDTGIGESKYDEGTLYDAVVQNEDIELDEYLKNTRKQKREKEVAQRIFYILLFALILFIFYLSISALKDKKPEPVTENISKDNIQGDKSPKPSPSLNAPIHIEKKVRDEQTEINSENNSLDTMLRESPGSPGESTRILTENYYRLFFDGKHTIESSEALLNFRDWAYKLSGIPMRQELKNEILKYYWSEIPLMIYCLCFYENSRDARMVHLFMNKRVEIYRIVIEEYNKKCPLAEKEEEKWEEVEEELIVLSAIDLILENME